MWAGGPGSSAGKEADGGQSYYCMDGKDDIAAGFQDIAAAKKLHNPVTALNLCGEYDTYDGATSDRNQLTITATGRTSRTRTPT
jgi:hypothetical protein